MPKRWAETGTYYWDPAILEGVQGPNMLHLFFIFSRPPLLGCPTNVLSQASENVLGGLENKKKNKRERKRVV